MHVKKTLKESYSLLKTCPKAVVPQLISTAAYSIIWLSIISQTAMLTNPALTREQALSALQDTVKIIAASLIVYLIDVYTYAMYPQIAEDYLKKDVSLKRAFKHALKRSGTLLLFSLTLLIGLGVFTIASLPLFMAMAATQDAIISILFTLGLITFMILAATAVFFVIPVTMTEGHGIIKSYKIGLKMSARHVKDLMLLNIVFLALLLASSYILYDLKFRGTMAAAALMLFAATRFIQAAATAYVYVANQLYYQRVK